LAHEFILVIFGAEYANSVIALQILVWSEVCIFISMPMANVFNSLNKQTVITKITIVCLILNIGLNLILIQLFGIIGASITTVLTEAISLILTYIFIAKIGYGLSWKYAADLLRVAASSVLMGVFLICFRSLQLTILLPSAILLYFILLCLIKGIDKEDMALIKKIVLNGSK